MSDSELKKEKRNKGVLKVVGHNLSRACNNVQGHPYDMLKFWIFNHVHYSFSFSHCFNLTLPEAFVLRNEKIKKNLHWMALVAD